MKNRKKILIVGGTGFIGYHLAQASLKKGWKVTSISTKLPKKIRFLPKVKYIICDITNKKKIKRKITEYFHYVVNLGGYVDHSNKKKTFKSHYYGCKNLADFFLNKKLEAFIQIGSCIEYGRVQSPQKENKFSNPKFNKSVYGKAKLMSSIYLKKLFTKKGFPATILRLYLAYGPKQDINRFIPIIITGCIRNKPFPCSDGSQLRDFLHVKDVVNGIFKTLKNKKARGQIINIGSGKPRKIKEIIKLIRDKVKKGKPEFGKISLRQDEIIKLYPSIKKAKKIIKWQPKISFERGLLSTISYYSGSTIK